MPGSKEARPTSMSTSLTVWARKQGATVSLASRTLPPRLPPCPFRPERHTEDTRMGTDPLGGSPRQAAALHTGQEPRIQQPWGGYGVRSTGRGCHRLVGPASSWGGQLADQCSAKHCMVCIKFPETWASDHRQRPSSTTRPAAKHRGSSAQPPAGSRDGAANRLDTLDGIRGGAPRVVRQARRNIPMAARRRWGTGGKGRAGGRIRPEQSWPDRQAGTTATLPAYRATTLRAGTWPVAKGPSWLWLALFGNNIVRAPSDVEGTWATP